MSATKTDKMRAKAAPVARIARSGQRSNGSRLLTGAFAGLARLVHGGVIAPARRYVCRRACRRALTQLDDRLLRDIGLTRPEVDAVAHGLLTLAETSRRDAGPSAPAPRHRRKRKQPGREESS